MFDKEKNENVENLRTFVTQEAEFEMAAAETIHSLHRIGNKAKIDHTYFGSSQQSNKFKYQKKCAFCNLDHSLWDCVQFKQLEIGQRWDVARKNKLCHSVSEELIMEKLAPKRGYVESMVVKYDTVAFYTEASLLEQTMKKMGRKRNHIHHRRVTSEE